MFSIVSWPLVSIELQDWETQAAARGEYPFLAAFPSGCTTSLSTVPVQQPRIFELENHDGGSSIHPVAVNYLLPIPVHPRTATSSFLGDLFWGILVQPFVRLQFTILPAIPHDLTPEQAAELARAQMVEYGNGQGSFGPKKSMSPVSTIDKRGWTEIVAAKLNVR